MRFRSLTITRAALSCLGLACLCAAPAVRAQEEGAARPKLIKGEPGKFYAGSDAFSHWEWAVTSAERISSARALKIRGIGKIVPSPSTYDYVVYHITLRPIAKGSGSSDNDVLFTEAIPIHIGVSKAAKKQEQTAYQPRNVWVDNGGSVENARLAERREDFAREGQTVHLLAMSYEELNTPLSAVLFTTYDPATRKPTSAVGFQMADLLAAKGAKPQPGGAKPQTDDAKSNAGSGQ